MVGHNKKNKGYEVETFVLDKFLELGFSAQTRNAYYDLDLEKNNIKKQLEIKSTNFIIKNGSGVLTYGRFYFDVSNVKDQVKNNVDVVAVTASGITFGFSLKQTNGAIVDFKTTIEAHFYPEKSWYIKEKGNDHILAHEQLHFDITELHVRKLRYLVSQLKVNPNIKQQLKQAHEQANEELRIMQNTYDKESMNSIHKLNQVYWNTYVKKELDKYQEFQSFLLFGIRPIIFSKVGSYKNAVW